MLTITPVNSIMVTITSVNEKEENKGQLRISEIHITKEEILEIHYQKGNPHCKRNATSTQNMNLFEMGLHDEQFFAHGWISSKWGLNNLRQKKKPPASSKWAESEPLTIMPFLVTTSSNFPAYFGAPVQNINCAFTLVCGMCTPKINTFLVKHQNWTMLVYCALTYSF